MNKINKLLDKLKSDINDTKDIDNNCFVEQALTTLNELKKQLTLTDVSQQRELLLAFEEYCCKLEYLTPNYEMLEKHINNFLANNCG